MSTSTIINASGLSCPQPVILAKKALQEHDKVTVIVDNTTAVENIMRLAKSMNCSVETLEEKSGRFEMRLTKGDSFIPEAGLENISCDTAARQTTVPNVFVINSETMGKGNDVLGTLLMKSFIHTIIELEKGPDTMIFYNTGVKLTATGSEVIEDLKILQERGIKILVCGTCLNFFNLKDEIQAGIVSNMYDIAGALSAAARIVIP